MLITGLAAAAYFWRQQISSFQNNQESIELANPLKLSAAISFGLLLAGVLLLVEVANDIFGTAGVYGASVLSGLVDVNAITLSDSEHASTRHIEENVAALAIVLAMLINTGSKAVIACSVGTPSLRRNIIRAFGAIILAGIISTGLVLFSGFA